MRKIRPKILKVVTVVAVFVLLMFMTSLDKTPIISSIVCGVCLLWLLLIFAANCRN